MAGRIPFQNGAAGAVRATPVIVGGIEVSASAATTVSVYNGGDATGPSVYEGKFAAAGGNEYVDFGEGVECTALFVVCAAGGIGVIHTV